MKISKLSRSKLILLIAVMALIIFVLRNAWLGKGEVDSQTLLALARYAWFAQDHESAEQKIRDMGTDALPSLVRALEADYSPLHKQVAFWVRQQKWLMPLRRIYPGFELPWVPWGAVEAFKIPGPKAYPAIPALENALTNPISSRWAIVVLGDRTKEGQLVFGPGIYTIFLKELTNSDPWFRQQAIAGLRAAQTNADVVVPALLHTLRDPDPEVRSLVASLLDGPAYCTRSADIIPAIIPLLFDENSKVREFASIRLKLFGAGATNALPVLSRLSTEDVDPNVRYAASKAVEQIRAKAQ